MSDSISAAEVNEVLELVCKDLYGYGSFGGASKDFLAVMKNTVARRLASIEIYRVLMEPVFRYQEEGWETAVTVFQPLRDMTASEVYNWMLHFKCLDVDYDEYEDVALVLDPALRHYWKLYASDMRGRRLFLTPDKDRLFQEGCGSGGPLRLEYVTLPSTPNILPEEVIRTTGYASQTVRETDLVIAWNFPADPVCSWHR